MPQHAPTGSDLAHAPLDTYKSFRDADLSVSASCDRHTKSAIPDLSPNGS
jgi:hypothetical protein